MPEADKINNTEQEIFTRQSVIQNEVHPASLIKRLTAYFVDLVIFMVTSFYLYNMILDVNLYTFIYEKDIFIWSAFSIIIFYQFYFFISEFLWKGKTAGKYLLNIKTVTKSGDVIKFSGAFIRNFSRIINFFPPLFFIPDLVCIFISKNHRSIADFIAGSVVINTKK